MAKCLKCDKETEKEHSILLCEECYNKYLSYRAKLGRALLSIENGEMLVEDVDIKPFFNDMQHKKITGSYPCGTKRIPEGMDKYIYMSMRNKILHGER